MRGARRETPSGVAQEANCPKHFYEMLKFVKKIYIVSHSEDPGELVSFLCKSGFVVEVLRQDRSIDEAGYSASYKCFLNHRKAWQKAARVRGPVCILEKDFVPSINFAELPVSYPKGKEWGIAYIYACGPQMYSVDRYGKIEGASTSTVGYLVNPDSASLLLEFAHKIDSEWRDHSSYRAWDSEIVQFFLSKGIKCYLPFRNYGEHGGLSNPEHSVNFFEGSGLRRFRPKRTGHRADVLAGRLAFLPEYAKNSRSIYLKERLWARLYGLARLCLGVYLRPGILRGSSFPARLLLVAIKRHLTLVL